MARLDPDKAIGALLGLAVGDALGAPVEGSGPDELGGKHTEMTGGGPHDLRPGQGTGDTEMALRLATSLIELGGYDADRTLGAYVDWYRTDPPGMSDHMRQVLGSVDSGADAYRATSAVHRRPADPDPGRRAPRRLPAAVAGRRAQVGFPRPDTQA